MKSSLIIDLVDEHKQILHFFEEIQKIGLSSEQKFELLLKIKDLLLNHLNKEDNHLYPPLTDKAKSDSFLQIKLNTFGTEMDNITAWVNDFYNKYTSPADLSKPSYPKDIAYFLFTLKNRVMKEEISIYKAYDELNIEKI